MKLGFLITARLKSSRLAQKLLLRLQGDEVVRHVIRKAKMVAGVDEIILCTSTHPQDEPLVKIAAQEGISYYMGDPDDVLKRLRDAATFYKIDSFLSLTADNPLFDIDHANQVSNIIRLNPRTDYVYATGLPIGASLYGLRTKALDVVCSIKTETDTEIWGPFINQPQFFDVHCLIHDTPWEVEARLTMDELADYLFQTKLLEAFSRPLVELDMISIHNLLKTNKELLAINANVQQKAPDATVLERINSVYANNAESIQQQIQLSKQIG